MKEAELSLTSISNRFAEYIILSGCPSIIKRIAIRQFILIRFMVTVVPLSNLTTWRLYSQSRQSVGALQSSGGGGRALASPSPLSVIRNAEADGRTKIGERTPQDNGKGKQWIK